MEKNIVISIVCATKNAAGHLENCLQSIFEQRYPYIEVVIIDGDSTDGTQDILKKWNGKIAFWKSEPDDGIYYAMNEALNHITGDWVYFIGSDDVLLPAFSDFVEKEISNPSVIYYANVLIDGKKEKGYLTKYQHLKHDLSHQSVLYPASVFAKYRYDTKYKVSADYAMNLHLYGDKQYSFKYCDYTIAVYATTGFSSKYDDGQLQSDLPSFALKYFGIKYYIRLQFRKIKQIFQKKHLKRETIN